MVAEKALVKLNRIKSQRIHVMQEVVVETIFDNLTLKIC